MKVKDAMHKGAIWAGPDTSVFELAKMMLDEDIGAIPIGENDRLIGMVTDRDIVCRGLAKGYGGDDLVASDIMTNSILYCRENEALDDAIRLMETMKVRRLPVIDGRKRLVGMLAMGDICEKAGQDLAGEAIRGVAQHHM